MRLLVICAGVTMDVLKGKGGAHSYVWGPDVCAMPRTLIITLGLLTVIAPEKF